MPMDTSYSSLISSRPALLRALLLPPCHAATPGGRTDVVCHGAMLRPHESQIRGHDAWGQGESLDAHNL